MKKDYPATYIWYEKTWIVVILCITFFPLGLYALWKNSSISQIWKVLVTLLILIVIANLGDKMTNDKSVPIETTVSTNTLTENKRSEIAVEKENVNPEKDSIIEKLKAKAATDWPDDFSTQEFWVNEQIQDYEYMLSIEDNSIKRKAQRDWPLDFSTQKFWYNEQIESRERMK